MVVGEGGAFHSRQPVPPLVALALAAGRGPPPTRDITPFDSASMVSYDRRSHRSGRSEGHLVKYVPIADVVPKQSAASLPGQRISPPPPD